MYKVVGYVESGAPSLVLPVFPCMVDADISGPSHFVGSLLDDSKLDLMHYINVGGDQDSFVLLYAFCFTYAFVHNSCDICIGFVFGLYQLRMLVLN